MFVESEGQGLHIFPQSEISLTFIGTFSPFLHPPLDSEYYEPFFFPSLAAPPARKGPPRCISGRPCLKVPIVSLIPPFLLFNAAQLHTKESAAVKWRPFVGEDPVPCFFHPLLATRKDYSRFMTTIFRNNE